MHLENKDIRIWYELFQNKVRSFIKGCDEDENQSQTFSIDCTWQCTCLKVGWHLTVIDGYWTWITKFLLSALWNPGHQGSAAAPFWQWWLTKICLGFKTQKKTIVIKRGRMFDNGNVKWCILGRVFLYRTGHFCVEPGFLYRTMHFAVESSFFCVERVL